MFTNVIHNKGITAYYFANSFSAIVWPGMVVIKCNCLDEAEDILSLLPLDIPLSDPDHTYKLDPEKQAEKFFIAYKVPAFPAVMAKIHRMTL